MALQQIAAEYSFEELSPRSQITLVAANDRVVCATTEGDVLAKEYSAALYREQRGMTLVDTLVGIALMLVVFLGIFAAFELGVDVVQNNKARAGAVDLADQRMEYIRSLSYDAIGTVGGIPSGALAQSENVSWNGVAYTRRTVVDYEDDPADGTGTSDANGIPEDYKAVKVDVSWQAKGGARHITLVSRFSPPNGVETNPCGSPCGTLTVSVVTASGAPLAGANVSIENPGASPAVSLDTFTNASGTATLLGAPAATAYSIIVSQSGYSTAQTYAATGENTNPDPGNLTVAQNQTTSQTFAIDTLASKTVHTFLWINGQSTTTAPNVSFTMQGAKTIGSGPSGPVYKYSQSLSTDGSGSVTIPNLGWDAYTISVPASSGYDVASACNPQPESLAPGASQTTTLYLVAHTTNSLLVDVRDATSGTLLPGASVTLSRTGFSSTVTTDPCGQAFFSGLTASSAYSVEVDDSGYTTNTTSGVSVSGQSRFSVQLN